jgi:hypothetical protein
MKDGSKIAYRGVGLSLLLALAPTAAEPPVPLSLHVVAPAMIAAKAPRDIAVRIANTGAALVIVLPKMVRLRIEGQRAEYVPYPSPPVNPWDGARELAPGASMTVEFPDTSDRRGVWRLPPGTYRVRAIYEIPPDLKSPESIADAARIWRDRLESAPVTMTVN